MDCVVQAAGPEHIAAVSDQLRRAQRAWNGAGIAHRSRVLADFHAAISAGRTTLVSALERDTGRRWASNMEVDAVLANIERCRGYATEILAATSPIPTSDPTVSRTTDLVPYPLVGAIGPWNFPLQLALIDAVPALLAGCAVIVKPSEMTPRFVPALEQIIAGIRELSDVLSIVEGDGSTGAAIASSVDAVCFTGSTATGRKVAQAASERFIPAFLELGGKDPAIVLRSADLDASTSAILWGSTVNSGHSCMSIERVYVDARIFEPFVDLLVRKAEAVRLAYPGAGDGEIGPIITEPQIAVIEDQLRDALARGARVRTGGKLERLGGGTYLRPTVLTSVDHAMRMMQEETFGPIMPVMPFSTLDEAVELANDSQFGLSGAVFAGATDEALAVAHRLEVGGVSINDVCLTGFVPEAEKNSFKLSGLGGSRMGPSSVRRFLRARALLMRNRAAQRPWYYDAGWSDGGIPQEN